jgi:Zn-dependent M28 family amino/carboxypeptidase
VLFVNFAAEELGLLGSTFFVANTPVARDSIIAMLNFDMVGHLRNNRLIVGGVGTARSFRNVVDSVNEQIGLRLSMQSAMPRNSDDASFRIRGIPALRFYTGTHAHYHNTTDRADRINAPGMVLVTKLAEGVLRAIADQHD